jgi:hypothetical protein
MSIDQQHVSAIRLARTIASDMMIYNRDKVMEGLKKDCVFEMLEEEIKEAERFYVEKVGPEIAHQHQYLHRAIADVLIKSQVHLNCPLW